MPVELYNAVECNQLYARNAFLPRLLQNFEREVTNFVVFVRAVNGDSKTADSYRTGYSHCVRSITLGSCL